MSSKLKIRKTAKTVCIDKIQTKGKEWMTWWYCGIYKNQWAKSQPNVLVAFKEIIEGVVSEKVHMQSVPLTALGQVTVGSIWKDGVSQSEVDYKSEDFFEIDFSLSGWDFNCFDHAYRNNSEPPYSLETHLLPYKFDKNWLIEFKLPSGGKLVVPCLEFFSRCYGRSQELNRILATYPWSGPTDSCESKLYAPLDEPEDPNTWKVKLRKRLRNGDTTLLAHAKYDSYTKARAKSINAQIEQLFDPQSTSPIFIKVAPWFQGPAELQVKGVWFDNERSFLALQVMGCSDPDGILITRQRENSNVREGISPDGIGGEAWAGATNQTLVRPPDIVDLTGDVEPDHDTESVEILDQDFVVMGIPRAIVDKRGEKVTDRSGARRKGDDASAYSSGEQYGSGKGVGFASIHAKPTMDSHGTLIDMWHAMLYIQKSYPNKIKSVEWFTFKDGYKSTSPPNLIALNAFDEDEASRLPTATKKWIYYDISTTPVVIRGVMVVRMIINGRAIHIIELQRRPKNIKDKYNQEIEGEDSFKGFVIETESHDQFTRWLKRFLSDVRYIRGIVQKLTPYAPGIADAFAHKSAKHEEIVCEAAVINALSKVGIVWDV